MMKSSKHELCYYQCKLNKKNALRSLHLIVWITFDAHVHHRSIYRFASLATLYTADACGRPTAQTSCVVQMLPLPIPTRRPSTPAWIRCKACFLVTTLPPTTCKDGKVAFAHFTISCW